MRRILIIFGLAIGLYSQSLGQVYTNKVVGDKNESLADSLQVKPYPYSLPI